MPFGWYLSSIFSIFLAFGLIVGISWWCLWRLFGVESRLVSLLALLGIYTAALYLKPAWLNLSSIPLLVTGGLMLAQLRAKPLVESFFTPLKDWAVWGILVYCFLLFFFRWEPPGTDPVKWGSLARLIFEYQVVPGDTRPLTAASDLRGASLGVPLLIALLQYNNLIPWERIVGFTECLAMASFCFSLCSVLEVWFGKTISRRAALLTLMLFTMPQQYFAWGGTPTLVGACFGPLLVAVLFKEQNTRSSILYGMALSFCAYAHPIGVYVSALICIPLFFYFVRADRLKELGKVVLVFVLGFAPFFLNFSFSVSERELLRVQEWQQEMSQFLFREDHSYWYNLYTQLTVPLWSTAVLLSLGLILCMIASHRWRKVGLLSMAMFLVAALLVDNVRHWSLPLSFLVYPDRVLCLMVIPLSFPLAWIWSESSQNRWALALLFTIGLLGTRQFWVRLSPHLGTSFLTRSDRELIVQLVDHVPKSDCIKIRMDEPSIWIPVLAFRCTKPFHGLGMNSLDEEALHKKARWRFVPSQRVRSNLRGDKVVLDNGARLYEIRTQEH